MDLNQVIYTVFHAELESGSRIGPKPPQNPIFLKLRYRNVWAAFANLKIRKTYNNACMLGLDSQKIMRINLPNYF